MFYNKDMFDAANVEYPPTNADEAWSWDEFVEVAKQLTLDTSVEMRMIPVSMLRTSHSTAAWLKI